MPERRLDDRVVIDDREWLLEQAAFCAVPGYLVLRLRGPVRSLGQLDEATAGRAGRLLAATAAALERVVAAERVYCLSFCELERQLHFHLLPRTAWLASAFRSATGAAAGPLDGSAVFEWARRAYPGSEALPQGTMTVATVCERLRQELADVQGG